MNDLDNFHLIELVYFIQTSNIFSIGSRFF